MEVTGDRSEWCILVFRTLKFRVILPLDCIYNTISILRMSQYRIKELYIIFQKSLKGVWRILRPHSPIIRLEIWGYTDKIPRPLQFSNQTRALDSSHTCLVPNVECAGSSRCRNLTRWISACGYYGQKVVHSSELWLCIGVSCLNIRKYFIPM
jgi:hypothetical protein